MKKLNNKDKMHYISGFFIFVAIIFALILVDAIENGVVW